MLYSPRWEALSLTSLISWLEQMPADQEYRYRDKCGCLLAQYFTAMGFKDVLVEPVSFYHRNGHGLLPEHFNRIAQSTGFPWSKGARTFGAALARARTIAAQP